MKFAIENFHSPIVQGGERQLDIQYFLTFREVARAGSFTRAAESLGYAQSSVTVQIQKLEQAYGTVLFERFGRRMQLTPAGSELLVYANRIAEAFAESKEALTSESAGLLTIGTIETLAAFFLPPYLRSFREQYPQMSVQLYPATEDEIIGKVRSGKLDLALILDPPFSDADLKVFTIRSEPMVVAAAPGHPLASKGGIELADLQGQSLILSEPGCTYRAALEQALRRQQVAVSVVSELGSMEAIKQCVIYGLGIALIPRIAAVQEIEKGQLAALAVADGSLPEFFTQLIVHRKKYASQPLTRLISLLSGA